MMLLITLALPLLCDGRNLNVYENSATKIRPKIVAHRGSSGQLPEHTVQAYELAIQEGADFIECDMMATKDKQIVCLHDPWLYSTTDVAERKEFANRRRNLTIGGKVVFDWFSFDFTLDELKTLRRRQLFPEFRDTSYDGQFTIPTLQEHIKVAKSANRTVGIYPEVKRPELVNLQVFNGSDIRFEDVIVRILRENGYVDNKSDCIIQSFSVSSLQYIYNITKLRLVPSIPDSGKVLSNATLKELSKYCYGVGTDKRFIVEVEPAGTKFKISRVTDFVQRIHAFGLKVHAATFRNEDRYLAWDYGQDYRNEYKQFIELGVDEIFTDYPSGLYEYLNSMFPKPCSSAPYLISKHLITFAGILLASGMIL